MAYTSLPDSIIQVGKALTRTLFKTYIKDNLDDHESRLTAIEGASGKIEIFNEVVLNAAGYSTGGTITGLDLHIAAANFNLTSAKVAIFETGTLTGNLEIDVQVSNTADFTSSNSVFTTKPKIDYSTASDYDESSNTVFNGSFQSVTAGQYLRLDVSELPSGGLGKFVVYLIGEAS